MAEMQNKLDLNLFKEFGEDKCDADSDLYDPLETCNAVKRLIYGLEYYSRLNVANEKSDRDKFNHLVCHTYHNFLDDYIHLIDAHSYKLENINKALLSSKRFKICDIKYCLFTVRHEATNNENDTQRLPDSILNFYTETMDSLHFYLFHLFDVGLRSYNMHANDVKNDVKNDIEKIDKYFDGAFSRITSMINERKHLTAAFNRFSTNDKFNMIVHEQKGNSVTTNMDDMFEYLYQYNNNINSTSITELREYIQDEEFDTDTIQADINGGSIGNISTNVNDKQLGHAISSFIQAVSLQSSSFNIGFTFYYWDDYKKMKNFDYYSAMNQYDHDAYEISELFVQQKYSSFKEEISNYKHFNMTTYTESVITKINEYINTQTVKKSQAWTGGYSEIKFKYGILDGTALSFNHLLSLILYCDYTDLSRHFSSSFRALKPFEPLSSIKSRNANYWWMAKSLRETVQLFGDFELPLGSGSLFGPFYSGLCTVMAFPEFEIRLCSPVSTSKQIEVATRFADRFGCVVELNNTVIGHHALHGFNCGWISRYKEESEVLFMGGHYRIKIESVRIMNTHQNFEKFFGALAKFSKIFNGGFLYADEISSKEMLMISSLINGKLRINDIGNGIDEYTHKTFDAYCLNKKQIDFNLSYLSKEDSDKGLTDMILYNIRYGKVKQDINDKTNIFCKTIWKIFPNILTIHIYTTDSYGVDEAQISLLGLLSEIEDKCFKQITIRAVQAGGFQVGESWISLMWSSISNALVQQYRSKNLEIYLEKKKNNFKRFEDRVVIQKLS